MYNYMNKNVQLASWPDSGRYAPGAPLRAAGSSFMARGCSRLWSVARSTPPELGDRSKLLPVGHSKNALVGAHAFAQ